MEFRKANKADIQELVGIRLAYLSEDFEGMTKEQMDALCEQLPCYYEEHLEKDFIAYIAMEKESIVASVFLVILEKPANPTFLTGKIGNILNVYTKPEYRMRGLAGKLMDMAMKDAKGLNLSYLDLMATKAGYPLYIKKGFSDFESKSKQMRIDIAMD